MNDDIANSGTNLQRTESTLFVCRLIRQTLNNVCWWWYFASEICNGISVQRDEESTLFILNIHIVKLKIELSMIFTNNGRRIFNILFTMASISYTHDSEREWWKKNTHVITLFVRFKVVAYLLFHFCKKNWKCSLIQTSVWNRNLN